MHRKELPQLAQYNSFAVNAQAAGLLILESEGDLLDLASSLDKPFYVLGEGSNTLFIEDFAGTIIMPQFKGIHLQRRQEYIEVKVAAGENWHNLVCYCLEQGVHGLENLALIPGSVGAAPVQNIGAYGRELADFLYCLQWYDLTAGKLCTLGREECALGYRDSIFKGELEGRGIVTSVTLRLPVNWQPMLEYAGLHDLANRHSRVEPQQVFDQVVAIRQQKLPSPQEIANAGSFFKNPVVSSSAFNQLQKAYPAIPNYPLANGQVKLAAGWLIDQCGLKGHRQGSVGMHQHQALVLVNHGDASGAELWQYANWVQAQVMEKFALQLVPEVRILAASGLIN
jgi:UDP-N-acetylmuramate dehydrogenase